MSLYGIGIVISPSIGIPVGVFNLLMSEFEYIFWVNDEGVPSPKRISGSLVKSFGPNLYSPVTAMAQAPEPLQRPATQGQIGTSQRQSNGWDDTSESETENVVVEKEHTHDHRKARQTRRVEAMPFNLGNGQWPTFDEGVDQDFEKFRQRIALQQHEEWDESQDGTNETENRDSVSSKSDTYPLG